MSDVVRRKARFNHKCTFCGETIPKGSEYQDVTITPWGHPDNESYDQWRLHLDCLDFWNDGHGDGSDWVWHEEVEEFRNALEDWKKQRLSTRGVANK